MYRPGILCGIRLETVKPEMKNALLLCVTEKRTKAEIDNILSLIEKEI